MIRFLLLAILVLLLARAFWQFIDGLIEAAGGRPARSSRPRGQRPVRLERDPVCGTFVAPSTARAVQAGSSTRYFCSDRCLEQWRAQGGR